MRLEKAGKVLAVCSALVLGFGYVAYRHREQMNAPPQTKDGSSLPVVLPSSKNPNRITVLPSSKSIGEPVFRMSRKRTGSEFIIPIPGIPAGDEEVSNNIERPLLPSSKIGAILKPKDAAKITPEMIDAIFDEQKIEPTEEAPQK